MKTSILLSFIVIFFCAQKPAPQVKELQWMTIDDVTTSLQKEKRPVLIDLYTDWCGWCKVMDKKTYHNKDVSAYVQQKFYPVKFDAEGHKTITWNGKTYNFNIRHKVHDFAIYLSNGNLSYPTTVIIPVDGEPEAIPGYLAPNEFELIAKYFGEGKYGKVSFEEYRKSFKSNW